MSCVDLEDMKMSFSFEAYQTFLDRKGVGWEWDVVGYLVAKSCLTLSCHYGL